MIAILMTSGDLPAIERRLVAFPDMWLAVFGSIITAVSAALACFQLSLTGSKSDWTLLSITQLLVWIWGERMGCLRDAVILECGRRRWVIAAEDCVPLHSWVSLPLSLTLWLMLRRAYPLRAGLVSALGGLAAAASSASLLWIVHPFDATAADLLMHALSVVIVVLAARALGARTFR